MPAQQGLKPVMTTTEANPSEVDPLLNHQFHETVGVFPGGWRTPPAPIPSPRSGSVLPIGPQLL
jgi:hypothetical protein